MTSPEMTDFHDYVRTIPHGYEGWGGVNLLFIVVWSTTLASRILPINN